FVYLLLAGCYAQGIYLSPNQKTSEQFFNKYTAIIKKHQEAKTAIYKNKAEQNYQAGLHAYYKDCNPDKAVEYFKAAAEAGNVEAQFNLALCFERGEGVAKQDEKAAAALKQEALPKISKNWETAGSNAEILGKVLPATRSNPEGIEQK